MKLSLIKTYALILLISSVMVSAFGHTNQSTFIPRPLAYDAIQEYALNRYRVYHADYAREYERPKNKIACNVQTSIVWQESTNDDDLARYFLFGDKTTLVVDQQGNGDIGSGWLGLFAGGQRLQDFHGTFSIAPRRELLGFVLQYHHDVSPLVDGVWFEAMLPFVSVSHELNLSESITSTSDLDTNSFTSIGAALDNPAWHYGKFSPHKLSRSGLDDLLLKVGYGCVQYEHIRCDVYASLLVPLADRPTAEFVFEPMIGAGGHVGVGAGVSAEFQLIKTGDHGLRIFTNAQYRFLLPATEKRSFDLNGKPWSRYLIYNTSGSNLISALPGINFFTGDVRVHPGGRFDLLGSLGYNYSWFNIECGYRYYWKEGDEVHLDKPWPYVIDISAQADDLFLSNATIGSAWGLPAPGQGDFVAITQSELDLEVAEHKSAQTSTVYIALSSNDTVFDHPAMFGIGASYELTNNNDALEMWSVWGSASFGF